MGGEINGLYLYSLDALATTHLQVLDGTVDCAELFETRDLVVGVSSTMNKAVIWRMGTGSVCLEFQFPSLHANARVGRALGIIEVSELRDVLVFSLSDASILLSFLVYAGDEGKLTWEPIRVLNLKCKPALSKWKTVTCIKYIKKIDTLLIGNECCVVTVVSNLLSECMGLGQNVEIKEEEAEIIDLGSNQQ